jgi:hypothetical protein
MSGAVRAAATADTVVDAVRETDFPVLAAVIPARAPHGVRPRHARNVTPVTPSATATAAAHFFLSGSSGSVHAGVC